MKLFKRFAPRREQQKVALLDWLGVSREKRGMLSQATYFACLKILGESMGKMPLKLHQKMSSNGGVRTATEHPLYSILKYRPNAAMSATGFMSTVEMQRNHYGNAFVLISGGGTGTRLTPLDPNCVEIWYDDAAIVDGSMRLWYKYTDKNGLHVFSDEEILHFRTSTSLDGLSGLSVPDILAYNFDAMQAAQNLQNSFFTNGMTAKMVVQYTSALSDENRDGFLKILNDFAKGKKMDVSDLMIPIPVGTSITPLNLKMTDAQFVELKKYSALEIAAAMGIKPNQINDYEKSSYASAEAQQLSFYVDTLLYIIKMYEDELNHKLLSQEERAAGYFFKFNFNVLLRADLATQTNSLTTAIQNSLYTPNEAREILDMPALPGGDNLLCNGSMLPVRMAGTQYAGKEGTKDETV